MTASDEKNGTRGGSAMSAVVAELHRAWMDRELRLDAHKKIVRDAVTAFAKGEGPDPTRLLADLADMREDCNSVCSSLVHAIKREQQG